MTNKIHYKEEDSFKKTFKKLEKKFKTLREDLETAKKSTIALFHLHKIDNQSIVQVPGYPHEHIQIYKIRKFACKALKGKGVKSGIRIIYAYEERSKTVSLIEIYFKADQENENSVKEFLNDLL